MPPEITTQEIFDFADRVRSCFESVQVKIIIEMGDSRITFESGNPPTTADDVDED